MFAPITTSFFGGYPGGGEIILVLVVLLLVFGSKKLPGIARSLGRTLEEFRRASREVTNEIMRADEEPYPPPPGEPHALTGEVTEEGHPGETTPEQGFSEEGLAEDGLPEEAASEEEDAEHEKP
jgi:sec-independent protein translocase protein TatA